VYTDDQIEELLLQCDAMQPKELADSKVEAEALSTALPFSPLRAVHSVQKTERKDVHKFLNYVAKGQQDKAEAMLIINPSLATELGEVVESKRSFRWITGFQYALWSLDIHMCKMIQKYLSPEDAYAQAVDSTTPENAVWVKAQGINASHVLDELISAYSIAIDSYIQGKYDEGDAAWFRVGAIQGVVPAHVAQEFCHENRSFFPTPDFTDLSERLTRSQQTDEGEWFSCSFNGGLLGEHAVVRGANKQAQAAGCARGIPRDSLESDLNSIRSLRDVRVSQRLAIIDAAQSACRIRLPSIM
jgi:hypothetical protein